MRPRPRRTPQRDPDAEVRRLLADARHTEPMPGDVAARLDRVVAELAAGRPPEHEPEHEPMHAPVADLAARRRRRATSLLVAAAAVVAIGIGIDQLSSSSPSGSSSSAGSAPDAATRSGGSPGAEHGSGARSGARSGSRPGADSLAPPNGSTPQELSDGARSSELQPLVRLRPDHFTHDAVLARRLSGASYDTQSGAAGARNQGQRSTQERSYSSCQRAAWGRGQRVGVRYDGAPAVLVLRPPRGSTQVADLFRCGSTDLVRSSTLPFP